jgi:TM2 domain-containing membrane protein YozV
VAQSEAGQKKLLCGILGIVLGGLGVHRFLLGDTKGGIIRIVLSMCTLGAGSIIGIIEGIIYLTKSDEDFQKIYIEGKKAWF